jgi:hypothetical protein
MEHGLYLRHSFRPGVANSEIILLFLIRICNETLTLFSSVIPNILGCKKSFKARKGPWFVILGFCTMCCFYCIDVSEELISSIFRASEAQRTGRIPACGRFLSCSTFSMTHGHLWPCTEKVRHPWTSLRSVLHDAYILHLCCPLLLNLISSD